MPDRRYRRPLRSHGLRVAIACVMAASLSGCASLRMAGFGFGGSQDSCRSETWPTEVMGSVQRAETEDVSEPADDGPARVVEYSFTKDSSERVAEASPEPEAEDSFEPVAPSAPEVAEEENSTVSEPASEPVAEAAPVPEPPVAEQAAPVPPTVPEPPVAEPAAPEPQEDVIAKLPEPAAPAPPPPTPEVVEVCGATDKACQDQLAALLADPMHKWIRAKPTERDERSGVRILAYRVLTPVLACEDLRQGLRETKAVEAEPDQPDAQSTSDETESPEWVQLLRRAVELELRAELAKRC